MRQVYKCFHCGKWFREAKMGDHGPLGKVEVCPFCGRRVYQISGIKAALVRFWWWLKELFSSDDSRPIPPVDW